MLNIYINLLLFFIVAVVVIFTHAATFLIWKELNRDWIDIFFAAIFTFGCINLDIVIILGLLGYL